MNIYVNKVSTNKSTINSPQGFSLPVIICNAFEIGQLQVDLMDTATIISQVIFVKETNMLVYVIITLGIKLQSKSPIGKMV